MLLLKMGPEVSSRARRALPALRRSKKEDGHRPSEFLVIYNNNKYFYNKTNSLRIKLRSQFNLSHQYESTSRLTNIAASDHAIEINRETKFSP